MAINYIPGPESILAPAVREISTALEKFINPNRHLQEQMQQQIAMNPELLRSLADTEKETPGTMANLGLGAIGQIIAGQPGTPQGEALRTRRPEAVRGAQLNIENMAVQNENVNKVLQAAAKEIAANSELTTDAAYQQLVGRTKSGYEIEKAQATAAPRIAAAAGAEADLQLSSFERTMESMRTSFIEHPDLGTLDLRKDARDFIDGKLSVRTSEQYLSDPRIKTQWAQTLSIIAEERARTGQMALASMRTGTDKALERQQQHEAFIMYRDSNVGSPDMWRRFMDDPVFMSKGIELMEHPERAKPEERELLAMARFMSQQSDLENVSKLLGLRKGINEQLQIAVEAPAEQKDAQISTLNTLLETRAAAGGPKLIARYNTRGFFRSGVIEFVDETGKIYNENEFQAVIADINNGQVQLTPDIEPVVNRMLESGIPIESAFQAYKAQETDTAKLGRVEQYLRGKRYIQ